MDFSFLAIYDHARRQRVKLETDRHPVTLVYFLFEDYSSLDCYYLIKFVK